VRQQFIQTILQVAGAQIFKAPGSARVTGLIGAKMKTDTEKLKDLVREARRLTVLVDGANEDCQRYFSEYLLASITLIPARHNMFY